MVWVYEKGKDSTIVYGSYPKKVALKLFKGKKGFVILDLKKNEDLNKEVR